MTTDNPLSYVGSELDLFSQANNWRSYWSSIIYKYLRGSVLEVGAGIGTNTKKLQSSATHWTALEPDPTQCLRIEDWIGKSQITTVQVKTGTLVNLPDDVLYNAILYIDVLEHIADDASEIQSAYAHLSPGGKLIVLSPAHEFLYTPFDKSIGHFRRYNKSNLLKIKPYHATTEFIGYLDSAGLLASLGNKILLKKSMPTMRQIKFWDNLLVPISSKLDRVFNYRLGKSILAVWQKPLSPFRNF